MTDKYRVVVKLYSDSNPDLVESLNSKVKCDNLIFENKIKDCRNENIPSIYLERKA